MAERRTSSRHLILFDGSCGMCRQFAGFVAPRNPGAEFGFAPLEGPLAQQLLAGRGIDPGASGTVFVLADRGTEREALLERSAAALFVAGHLKWPWKALAWLGWLPRALLDFGYNQIARNRHKLAGRADSCPLPDSEFADRLLE